jgi:Ca2+-binding RTX toxin-like protein
VLTGGLGVDTYHGLGGADTFRFDQRPNKTKNFDKIMDFQKVDTIELAKGAFSKLSKGTLKSKQFYKGVAAHDADDRLIADPRKGYVYYDADGNGRGAAIKIFEIKNKSIIKSMTAADFVVI